MKALHIAASLSLMFSLALTGCVTQPQNFAVTTDAHLPSLTAVRCGDSLSKHVATSDRIPYTFTTGPTFAKVFCGGSSSPATVELVSAQLDEVVDANILWGESQLTYTVTVLLQTSEGRTILSATGRANPKLTYTKAIRSVTEQVATNLARQIDALMHGVSG